MKRWLAAIVAAGACAFATQAYAHHSFPDSYLEGQTVTIQGELAQILLRNPHSLVQVVVKERNGSLVRYAVEWISVTELMGQGMTPDTLKLGDFVVISGAPGRIPTDHRVRMTSLRRPKDGLSWTIRPRTMSE